MGGVAILPGVAPPALINPIDAQAKVANLGDIYAQRQLRQQEAQENTIKLQQMQQAQQDDAATRKAFSDNNYDPDKTLAALGRYGVSPAGVEKATLAHADTQLKLAQVPEAQLNIAKAKGDAFAGYLEPLKQIQDPAQRMAAAQQAFTDAKSKGLVGPNDVLPSTLDDQSLDTMIAHAKGGAWYADNALKTQQAARENTKAQNDAKIQDLDIAGRAAPTGLAGQDPEAAQATWDSYRSKLSPSQQALVPEQWSPDAEKQVRNQALTVEQQTANQRAQAEIDNAKARLAAEGITPDDLKAVEDPNGTVESRRAAADAIVQRKGDAQARVEIAKQLGIVQAMLGGNPTSGQPTGTAPQTGTVQIPTQAPGQPGVTQLAAQNNNPGNLRFAGQSGAKPGAGGYAAFTTPEAGYAALQNQIAIDTKNGLTLQQYITKYAPPQDKNNTPLYIQQAAQAVGMSPDTPLSQVDANKLAQFQAQKESSTTVNGTPPTNGRNEAVLDNAVKAGKISQATANEIRSVADGQPIWPQRTGAMGLANQAKEQLLYQYAPDYKPGQAPIIKPGTPEFKVAQDLAYGNLTFPQFRSLYSYSRDVGKKTAIYEKAADLNPGFNPAGFELGYNFAKNPQVRKQLASLDNVQSGVNDLLRVSDAAARTDIPILNKYLLPGGVALGSKNYSNLKTARTAFADELSGALGYGSATDMSREMGFDMTDPNLSPAVFKSNVQDILIPFVERKRKSLTDQMGIYGQPGSANPGVTPPSTTPPGGSHVTDWKAALGIK